MAWTTMVLFDFSTSTGSDIEKASAVGTIASTFEANFKYSLTNV